MSIIYTVQPGDNLSSIAARYGLRSWQDIYFHPDNAPFRVRRPNPNLIYVGDTLALPIDDPGMEECLRECESRFHENHHLPFNDRVRAKRRCQRDCHGRPA